MPTDTLNPPRTIQPATASNTEPPPSLPTMGKTKTRQIMMSWAEWAATPRDFRLAKGTQRWVMRAHPAGGVALFPVHITG